ncbi:MAG: hypothetical protein AB1752_09695 [Candidatus Zixiibacteriota bacterium]
MTHPTPISPLAFTRAYNTYRADSADIAFADTRLLAAARFWTPFAGSLADPVLSSFIAEDWPPLLDLQDPPDVEDLRPAEIEEIARFLDMVASHRLKSREREAPVEDPVSGAEPPVAILPGSAVPSRFAHYWQAAARKHLYVGDADSALTALKHAGLIDESTVGQLSIPELPETANATDLPSMLAEWAEANHPMSARWFREFDSDWSAKRESGEINQAQCLVVEYDPNGHPVRGRLRALAGTVEQIKRADASDEVTVHHQVRAPDDPHFGAIYNALAALRRTLRHRGDPSRLQPELRIRHPEERSDEGPAVALRGPRFHARLTLGPSTAESHTGDSIGLAAFALAYANWWAADIHRERRLIGSSVAFTGGIAGDGSITPVSPATLRAKIARAFHSPITHLVIPEASRRPAESELAHLRTRHPRRRLHLIGIESPHDLIADHNILRTEKVCLGEFAARKAARWGRSVKVQVVVLVVLLYLLASIVSPQMWLFFDWEPATIKVHLSELLALNAQGQIVGRYGFDTRQLDTELHEMDAQRSANRRRYSIFDLDGDHRSEICFIPAFSDVRANEPPIVFVFAAPRFGLFGRQLDTLFTRSCCEILAPDSALTGVILDGTYCTNAANSAGSLIITSVTQQFPARNHLRFFDAAGAVRGWFVHRGILGEPFVIHDSGEQRLVFLGVNNSAQCAAAVRIDPERAHGLSPQITEGRCSQEFSNEPAGFQYVLFPKTDVGQIDLNTLYNTARSLEVLADGTLRIGVLEGGENHIFYRMDHRFRPFQVDLSDGFIRRRQQLVDDGMVRPLPLTAVATSVLDSVQTWPPDHTL